MVATANDQRFGVLYVVAGRIEFLACEIENHAAEFACDFITCVIELGTRFAEDSTGDRQKAILLEADRKAPLFADSAHRNHR